MLRKVVASGAVRGLVRRPWSTSYGFYDSGWPVSTDVNWLVFIDVARTSRGWLTGFLAGVC